MYLNELPDDTLHQPNTGGQLTLQWKDGMSSVMCKNVQVKDPDYLASSQWSGEVN